MIAVVACGNLARRDDGAGPAVLAALRKDPLLVAAPGLRLLDAATDGLAVLFAARGARELIVIDACRSGQPPGAVFEVPGEAFVSRREPPRDSHALRWDDALTIAQRMSAASYPATVRVYLIEVADTGLGLELSAPVAAAVEQLNGRLRLQLHRDLRVRAA